MRGPSVFVIALLTTACGALIGLEDVPPSGAALTADIDDAVGKYASAYCQRLFDCQRGNFDFNFDDNPECVTAIAAGQRELATLDQTGATPDALRTCAANLSSPSLTCEKFAATQFGFTCNLKGTKKTGEECFENIQCDTGFCGVDATRNCKTCSNPPAANGTCGRGGLCAVGYQCNARNMCVSFGTDGQGCDDDHPCIAGFGCKSNLCVALPPILGGDNVCDPKFGCDSSRAFVCAATQGATTGTCVLYSTAPAGQKCNDQEAPLVLCRRNAKCNNKKCNPTPALGDPCAADNSGAHCLFPEVCNGGECTEIQRATCE